MTEIEAIKMVDEKARIGDNLEADRAELRQILAEMKALQKRWCAEEVSDGEEMWIQIPEWLNKAVPKLERILGEKNWQYKQALPFS